MRKAFLVLLVLLLALLGFAYYRNPAGCQKLLGDLGGIANSGFAQLKTDAGPVISSLSSGTPPPSPAPAPKPEPVVPATPPPATPAAASATPAPSPAATAPPAPPPIKPWSPPAVMPAQPNWTWTTSDGTTYQNVVVTGIGPETVSITHAMGVAHDIPIANLPPDVQQKLNYDPVAAAAARKEAKREEAQPYFAFAQRAAGQDLARQMHWPVAWMDTEATDLAVQNPVPNSEADLSQRALNRLKKRTIVILADGNNDLLSLPPVVLSQMFILDDGPMPGGHHFYAPKTVLTDPDATKALGRISQTQLIGGGDATIDEALAAIPADAAPSGSAPSGSAPATNAPAP